MPAHSYTHTHTHVKAVASRYRIEKVSVYLRSLCRHSFSVEAVYQGEGHVVIRGSAIMQQVPRNI